MTNGPALANQVKLRTIFSRFWPYTRGFRQWLLLVLALSLLLPVTQTVTIWLFKWLLDDVLVPRDMGAFLPVAGIYVAVMLLTGAVGFAHAYLSQWVSRHFILKLQTRLFSHVHHLSPTVLETHPEGDLLARLTGDIRAIEKLVISGVTSSIAHALRILLFVGALFWLQWCLALIALIVLPLFALVVRVFSKRLKAVSRQARYHHGQMVAVAEESLGNAPLVQSFQRQAYETDRFYAAGYRQLQAQLQAAWLQAAFGPLLRLLELAGILAVIALGTWQMSQDHLTLGGLLAFMGYLSGLFSPVRSLSKLVNKVFAASASAERILELFHAPTDMCPHPEGRVCDRIAGDLEFEHVAFAHAGSDQSILQDVSFHLAPGQSLALIGASGAGKTTLARLIPRLHDPSGGCIRLDGHDLRELSLDTVRSSVTVLMQEPLLFNDTVFNNIAYGRPDVDQQAVRQAACAADAHGFIEQMARGYDTLVGEKGRRLSGGQRQRLAMARALIRDAPILILDEPSAGLDRQAQERIRQPLQRLMAGRTTIIIAHDSSRTVVATDRVIRLEKGCALQG